jgi:hypothetical protein
LRTQILNPKPPILKKYVPQNIYHQYGRLVACLHLHDQALRVAVGMRMTRKIFYQMHREGVSLPDYKYGIRKTAIRIQ